MRNFICYLKSRRRVIAASVMFVIIFFLCFYLMNLPLGSVWYPSLICVCGGAVYAAYDYIRYAKKHRRLTDAINNIDVTTDRLPAPHDLIEQDYQRLLDRQLTEKNRKVQEIKLNFDETTEYVTLWSHQIKTPLTALKLTVDGGACDESCRAELLSELFEIDCYVDVMLQFLRLSGSVNDLVIKDCGVKSMVSQSVKYFARLFISKDISVEIDIDEGLTAVTDEKWFVFVIKQIISNSLKYTEKGGRIRASVKTEDGVAVCLSISDNGIGIAASDLPRIFERGYTGYNGRKDKKASGLGLYLVRRITDMLGHKICVESKAGVGTTVRIILPMGESLQN